MRRSVFHIPPPVFYVAAILLAAIFAGCASPTGSNLNSNANANLTTNTNTTPANTNANSVAESLSGISAREPNRYRATLVFSAETAGGDKTIGIPTFSAVVARSGEDRRVAFKLPDGSDLIYIDSDGHHFVVLPARKQYAELTPEAGRFSIQRLMRPGQIVMFLGRLKGVERVGEETLNGRAAIKYSYNRTVETKTQAGEEKKQRFEYIAKQDQCTHPS